MDIGVLLIVLNNRSSLNNNRTENPEKRGWFIGHFIEEDSVFKNNDFTGLNTLKCVSTSCLSIAASIVAGGPRSFCPRSASIIPTFKPLIDALFASVTVNVVLPTSIAPRITMIEFFNLILDISF